MESRLWMFRTYKDKQMFYFGFSGIVTTGLPEYQKVDLKSLFKDKNGKPIFSGDIVEVDYANEIHTISGEWEVIFDGDGWYLSSRGGQVAVASNTGTYSITDISAMEPEKRFEIIGNIYETKGWRPDSWKTT